jgi:hypothetical protein
MPNVQPANLIEPAIPSNVTNPQVPNTLSTQHRQSDDSSELQVARDNFSHAFASGAFDSELADKRRNGHGHPNVVAQQPTQNLRQTFRDMWPTQNIIEWPLLAHNAGLAQAPCRLSIQVDWPERNNLLWYYLPRQDDWFSWDGEDARIFMDLLAKEMSITVDWNDLDGYFPNDNLESAGADPVETTTTGGDYQPGHASQHALDPALTIPQGPLPDATGGWIVDGAGGAPFDAQSDEVLSAREILADWQSSKGETFEHKRDENMLTEDVATELHGLVGHFSSQQAREDYLDTHDQTWEPPRGDDTIPKSEEQMKKIVTDLVFAMSSTEFAADSEANNALKTRWLLGKLFYKKEKIVLRCWQLAEITKKLHEEGPSALHCFDDRYARSEFAKTQSWTFRERMDVMISLLATRKSRCDALMKGDQIDVFVGAPGKLLKTATQNAPNNAKKGEALKRGREAIKVEEDKAATSQTAKKSASTSRPAPVPVQNLSGHQVAALARTTDLNARETSQQNTDLGHQPHPGFRNREHLDTAVYPSPTYTPDSTFTTPGSHIMTNTGSYSPQDLWENRGATSRTNSRGFVQHPESYGTPHDGAVAHGDPGQGVSSTQAPPPYRFPVDGRTQGSNLHQPSFPGLPSMLSQKRPAVGDLNDATQKRPYVPSSFGAGPLPQQVESLHYRRKNTTRSLPANAQPYYTSSDQVPVDPQILQPPLQAQQPPHVPPQPQVQQPRVPSTASSPTVHPSASSSTAHTSDSLKRGPAGNIQDPAGNKRTRKQ